MGAIAYDNANNPTTYRGGSGLTSNANNQRTGQGWVYDGNGNPNNYNHRIATYDVFDRLASMGTPPVGYTYRADGLIATRAKAVFVFDPEEGEWVEQWQPATYFYHDGGEPVLERQSGAVTAITVRGPDGLVARKQGATWTYYTFDQQGNVSQRLDSAGVVVSSSVYDAYGAETTTGTAPTDACGYNAQWGYWLDRDTGLYLCQARWYDPVTGRWVTRDQSGYAGGANLYGYCGGGPVGWAVPNGLTSLKSPAGVSTVALTFPVLFGGSSAVSGPLIAGGILTTALVAVLATTLAGPCDDDNAPKWVTVGRWMSKEEYQNMRATGYVQASRASDGNVIWMALPPNPAGYIPQSTEVGFAIFHVPRSYVFPGGKPGWVIIGGAAFVRGGKAGLPMAMPPFANLGPWIKSP